MPTEELPVIVISDSNEEYVDSDTKQNKKVIRCHICGSKILSRGSCTLIDNTFSLPYMKSKDKDGNSLNDKTEEMKKFWLVIGMMTFENVGFTKTVDGLKYLICADCEIGPIGYQDMDVSTNRHYIAVDRVRYE